MDSLSRKTHITVQRLTENFRGSSLDPLKLIHGRESMYLISNYETNSEQSLSLSHIPLWPYCQPVTFYTFHYPWFCSPFPHSSAEKHWYPSLYLFVSFILKGSSRLVFSDISHFIPTYVISSISTLLTECVKTPRNPLCFELVCL